MERIAVYPGSFDPVTNGHLKIVEQGLAIFDRIIVTILCNPGKKTMFTVQERVDMLEESLKDEPRADVAAYQGLLVDFVYQRKATAILRGMRAVSDFEYEFQLALMNRKLARDVPTVFLMTSLSWIFTSSSIIKQAAQFGAEIDDMVPPMVSRKLKERFKDIQNGDCSGE